MTPFSRRRLSLPLAALALAAAIPGRAAEAVLIESARPLPVAYDVDIVVVGGSTAGVAAAVAAAGAGAKVFVAAPRTYLGEDLCAPYRLWLEPGEEPASPLAQAMFGTPLVRRALSFTYTASQPSAGKHPDTTTPSLLGDRVWGNAVTQSVQYDADVALTADLGQPRAVARVHLFVHQSRASYEVQEVALSVSADGVRWEEAGRVGNGRLGQEDYFQSALDLTVPLGRSTRFVRADVRKSERATRLLIGELLLEGEPTAPAGPGCVAAATPMQVKRALDQALLDAKVPFLFGCYATDLLRDAAGAPAGVVIEDRAGRQAVLAKVVIDATDRGWLARRAGVAFAPYPAGPHRFRRVVVGGEPRIGEGVEVRRLALQTPLGGIAAMGYGNGPGSDSMRKMNKAMSLTYNELLEYTLTLPMPDGSFAAFAAAEQLARDRTFQPAQVEESEVLFEVPPDPMTARVTDAGPWRGAAAVDLDVFRPAGLARFYVLGGCAAVPREAAAALLRPLAMLEVGGRVGAAAAREAASVPALTGVRLPGEPGLQATGADTREGLGGLRGPGPAAAVTIPAEVRRVPVVGRYDVVVVGGGTSGAPAAIAAARQGARTLVVEYLHGLGGVATTGLIGVYCAGYRKGFTTEVDAGVAGLKATCSVVGKMEWWRRELRTAGADIWFGAWGGGAVVEAARVRGVVVATPEGRGVVLAGTVIDATGNADIAAAAGAACVYTDGSYIGVQGAGLPRRELGACYINTDWTYIDDTDPLDIWSALVVARRDNEGAYDLGQLIDTRERRHIVGDYELSPLDVVTARTFPDTVGISSGGKLDKHSYTVHPYFLVNSFQGGLAYTPYRCLLPKGLTGILVTGLGLSAHADAIPSVRMQPCLQNLGYACGVAAAMAAKGGGDTRRIDMQALQRHLVEKACLTPEVPGQADSFPPSSDALAVAVAALAGKDYTGLALVLADPGRAQPLLRQAWAAAGTSPEGRLRCAHVLGLLGDPTGAETLVAKVASFAGFDQGNIGEWQPALTWLDSYLVALGRTRDPRAVEPLAQKIRALAATANPTTSHVRAVAWAAEALRDPALAAPLAALLVRVPPGDAPPADPLVAAQHARRDRGGQTPLILAAALVRCGDHQGVGEKALRSYVNDLRGHYAKFAAAVLAESAPAARR